MSCSAVPRTSTPALSSLSAPGQAEDSPSVPSWSVSCGDVDICLGIHLVGASGQRGPFLSSGHGLLMLSLAPSPFVAGLSRLLTLRPAGSEVPSLLLGTPLEHGPGSLAGGVGRSGSPEMRAVGRGCMGSRDRGGWQVQNLGGGRAGWGPGTSVIQAQKSSAADSTVAWRRSACRTQAFGGSDEAHHALKGSLLSTESAALDVPLAWKQSDAGLRIWVAWPS